VLLLALYSLLLVLSRHMPGIHKCVAAAENLRACGTHIDKKRQEIDLIAKSRTGRTETGAVVRSLFIPPAL
jgi:hypothetical protein